MAACSYIYCKKRRTDGVSLFCFPIQDKSRCEEWILNRGNADLLDVNTEDLAQRFVCEVHFDATAFRDQTAKRKLLNWNAVPVKFQDPISNIPSPGTPSPSHRSFGIISPPSGHSPSTPKTTVDDRVINMPSSSYSPRKAKLKRKIQHLKGLLNRSSCKNYRLKTKYHENCNLKEQLKKELQLKSIYVRILIMMQLYHKKRQGWTPQQRSLSVSLYYKSPGTYKFMRNTLGVIGKSYIY